jgi:hypothetical protein
MSLGGKRKRKRSEMLWEEMDVTSSVTRNLENRVL